jgi:hypothetical protein
MSKKRRRLAPKIQAKVTHRRIIALTAVATILIVTGLFLTFNFTSQDALGAVSGDYRSVASGNWSSTSTWQTFNGSSWVAASSTPYDGSRVINIQSGHTVTVTSDLDVDQLVVDAGGTLVISSGKTLTLKDGSGADFTVNGTVTITGTLDLKASSSTIIAGNVTLQSGGANTVAAGATITINNGGRYKSQDATFTSSTNIWTVNSGGVFQHDVNGGTIPQATWNTGSTCEVTGMTTTLPAKLDQSFYNFTWNCPNQTAIKKLSGDLTSIAGNFSFISSGTAYIRFGDAENYTMNVGGNFNVSGGELYATSKSLACIINIGGNFVQSGGIFGGNDINKDNAEGSPVINVTGNFSISAGTFDFSQYASSSTTKGITTLNLFGNFTQTGGTITETGSGTARGEIYFKKAGTQYFSKTSGTISNVVNYTISSGSVVDAGVSVFSSSGTFTLSSGGGLNMGSANGITQTSASGNVQVTGTRSYSTGADYTYNGTVAQVSGDGLPATVRYLTIYNSANLTLSTNVTASSMLYLTLGKIITNDFEIAVSNTGTSAISGHSSNSYVIGNLRRTVNSSGTYDFPVGSTVGYQLMSVMLSSTSGFSSLLSSFVPGDPAPGGLANGILKSGRYFNKMLNMGYWKLEPNSTMTSGTYGVAITGSNFSNKSDATSRNANDYTTLKRPGSGNNWDVLGTTDATKQVITDNEVTTYTMGYTTFSHFGQGTGGSTLPIKLMSFDAKLEDGTVNLNWVTAAEINNDYFTIERSNDGKKYTEIYRERGAGNSTNTLYYKGNDDSPAKGYNYYRLKQTDYDGHFSYSDVKTVRVKKSAVEGSEMKIESVYPNPFSDNFKINFTLKKSAIVNVVLMNANGQIVAQDKIQAVDGLNTYDYLNSIGLKNGIYIVALMYDDQKVIQKIIKN